MGAISTTKAVLKQVQEDNCQLMASAMAYNLLLALAPLLVFCLAVFGLFGDARQLGDQIGEYAGRVLPESALAFVLPLIDRVISGSSGGLVIVAILGALWAASGSAGVIMQGLRVAYDIEDRPVSFLKDKLLALLIVVSLGVALFLASNLMIFGSLLTESLITWLNLGAGAELIIDLVRWTVVIALILGFTAGIYSIVPSQSGYSVTLKQALPGAVVFVAGWLLVCVLFSFYVENFSNYNEVYGALGAVVVMMIWLYMTSLAMLVGGEVNAVLQEARLLPLGQQNADQQARSERTAHHVRS